MAKKIKTFLRGIAHGLRFAGKRINVGPGARIAMSCKIRTTGGGTLSIGTNTRLLDLVLIYTYGGDIKIGKNCSINPFCVLYGLGGLEIGDDVRIAAHTVIVPANHSFDTLGIPIWRQPETRKGVRIGNDVWIGCGCRILDGVVIGQGCVVGAGSVVTRNLPDYSIAVGVPARVIGSRPSVKSDNGNGSSVPD